MLAIAAATLRDLGRGCGGGFLLLLVVAAVWLQVDSGGRASGPAFQAEADQRLTLLAAFLMAAAVVASAWSVAEDRRSRRMALWLAAPLRRMEYLGGKMLGCFAGAALAGVPLVCGSLYLISRATPPDLELRPLDVEMAASAELLRGERRASLPPGHVLMQAGDAVSLRFERLPRAGAPQCLSLRFRGLAYDGIAPTSPRVSIGTTDQLFVTRRELVGSGGRLEQIHEVPFEASGELPVYVHVEAGDGFVGRLLLERDEALLLGERKPVVQAFLRFACGVLALQLISVCLAVLLAVALSDGITTAVAGLLLGVGFLRGLFLEVSETVGDLHHDVAGWIRSMAVLAAGILRWTPDLQELLGTRVLLEARLPWSSLDPAPFSAVPWLVALGLVLGWILLVGVRRWFA